MAADKDNLESYSSSYTPRPASRLGEGYSLLVKTLKFTLPLVVLVILGVLIAHLWEDDMQTQIAEMPKAEKTTPGQIEVIAPKYESVDEKGEDYTITADSASRSATGGDDGVVFTNPLADIVLDNKTWLALKGSSGFFDRAKEYLTMKDGVTIFHDSGYEFAISDIEVNLREKTAKTSSAVTIKGPAGTMQAQYMQITNAGNLIIFGGPILLKIFNLSPRSKDK